jgi:alkanesulfonate monooxygenase SsuD/methylene tetrahydromethanopterin reductase-like flavin-dependent oxidoreductase (luciferase family)
VTADIFLTSRYGPARSLDLAKVAQRAGLRGVWLAEHYFVDYGRCPSATVLASAILASTSLSVGTAACVMSARDPVRLGLEASMLREVYGERFQLGVARGGPWRENIVLGRGMDYYRTGFADWLDTLLSHYAGPVRVAATSPSTVELAAHRGMPLILGVEHCDASAERMVRQWQTAARPALAGQVAAAGAAAGHARVVIASPDRADLARWLSGIGDPSRDLGAHLDHLMTVRAGPVDGIDRVIRMVEAAGSFEATVALIERLETVC